MRNAVFVLTPRQLRPVCPVQPCRGTSPWCMWLCPFLLVMANEGQAPEESLSSQRHSRWETEERLGHVLGGPILFGKGKGIHFQRIKKINP